MSKSKLLLLLTLPLLAFITIQCNEEIADPAVVYRQIIENRAQVDLLLRTSIVDEPDSIIIPSNSELIFIDFSSIGAISSFENCDLDISGNLLLEVASTDTLTVDVDPNLSSNWEFTLLEDYGNGGGSGECRLFIDDQDIK